MDTRPPAPTLRLLLGDDDEPLTLPAEFEVASLTDHPRVELEPERFDEQILAALVAP
jgi:hypothetical protein